ncbi:MAG: hypothetical protein WA664_05780 [Candidatus Acidiferrales bacterium]
MNRQFAFLLSLMFLLLTIPSSAGAQAWTGILNSGRAIDWSQGTGIPGGVPNYTTQCGSTIAPYSGTAATINSAIASCPTGQFVHLGTGTFNISNTIVFAGHGVVLRGDGPLKTILKFNGGFTNCGAGQGCAIQIGPSANVYDGSSVIQPGGSNSLAITGTTEGGSGVYPQGATHIQVSNVGSDTPVVGTMLFLDQVNDQSVVSGVMQCDNNVVVNGKSCASDTGSFGRGTSDSNKRSQVQAVIITAINGSTYTISPGIYFNNIRASQSPGAWWNFSSQKVTGAGLENLTAEAISSSHPGQTITFIDAYRSWTKNVRTVCIDTGNGCPRSHYLLGQSLQIVLRDGYVFGSRNGGGAEGYGIESTEDSGCLVENTIIEQNIAPLMTDNISGCIIGYNFAWNDNGGNNNSFMQVAYTSHDTGNAMNLYEGNDFPGVGADNQHGASPLSILFRNHLPGNQPVPNNKVNNGGAQTNPMGFDSYNRIHSVVGNVLGIITCAGGSFNGLPADENSQCTGGSATGPSYHTTYEVSPAVPCPSVHEAQQSIFNIGFAHGYGCDSGSPGVSASGNDPELLTSMMRWGNCDSVTNSCRFNSSEVPTAGGTFYSALSVPATHALPASFYYTSKPSWYASAYGTPPWPPIGPDVTGGDLATRPAGVANRIPARLCWDNSGLDSTNYPGTAVRAIDANVCYNSGSASDPPPVAPTNIIAIVH